LLCGGVVLWTRVKVVQLATRRIRPGEGARAIKLQVDHKRLPPGGEVTGHVEVTRTGRVRRLEVSVLPRPHPELRWNHVETHDWALATGALSAPTELPFALRLPPDATPGTPTTMASRSRGRCTPIANRSGTSMTPSGSRSRQPSDAPANELG
jgi:hypothetical protein